MGIKKAMFLGLIYNQTVLKPIMDWVVAHGYFSMDLFPYPPSFYEPKTKTMAKLKPKFIHSLTWKKLITKRGKIKKKRKDRFFVFYGQYCEQNTLPKVASGIAHFGPTINRSCWLFGWIRR